MIYQSPEDWLESPRKRVLLFGMSGLGKTRLAGLLRAGGEWFHYSVDYRIGTRYMGEHIADNAKREAMKNPFLAGLLLSDSIHIASNISFDNLTPVSSYLGKPGDGARGGLAIGEYRRRQQQFRAGEIAALMDTAHFIARAWDIYRYPHFVCDTGGSVCEWIDPEAGLDDPLLAELYRHCLLVWIEGSEAHTEELIRRFDRAPKPMAYQPAFLDRCWQEYLTESKCLEGDVDPDDFIRWTYGRALQHRQPLYRAMARFGVTISAAEAAAISDGDDFEALIATALARA